MTDRELDALVAEKVMGQPPGARCSVVDDLCELPNSSDGWYCGRCGFSGGWGDDADMKDHPKEIRHYSTTGDGMLAVIEAMDKRYGLNDPKAESVRTFMLCPDMENGVPTARWYAEFPLPRWEEAAADTAPRAVCLAALKALGEEVA